MRFDFGDGTESSFIIDFVTFDESKRDYLQWTLQLVNLISFCSTPIEIASDSDLDFFSFDIALDGTFKGDMLLRTGFAKPLITINFECRSFILSDRQ